VGILRSRDLPAKTARETQIKCAGDNARLREDEIAISSASSASSFSASTLCATRRVGPQHE
jgi:hypothetical protein